MDGKTLFFREWLDKGILSIQDLLRDTGRIMSYAEFISRYVCKVNFLQYYQAINAIPKNLLNKAKTSDLVRKEIYPVETIGQQEL